MLLNKIFTLDKILNFIVNFKSTFGEENRSILILDKIGVKNIA